MTAAIEGSHEIGFTIVSMTVSLVAVFIPVLFMGGLVGRLLHEFAVTIAVAILISGFVSLTFTPMLCSRFLHFERDATHGFLYRSFDWGFKGLAHGYDVTLRLSLRHKFLTLLVALAMLGGTVDLFLTMPKGFIPSSDQGYLFGQTLAGQDISYASMARHQRVIADVIMNDPNVENVFVQSSDTNTGIALHGTEADQGEEAQRRSGVGRNAREDGADSRHPGVPAESSADHAQRPEHAQLVPDGGAERQSARDLRVGAAADRQIERPEGIPGHQHRSADPQPAIAAGYQPRPCRLAGHLGQPDRGRVVLGLRHSTGVDDLHAFQSVFGDHRSRTGIPGVARHAVQAVHSLRTRPASAAGHAGEGDADGRPAIGDALRPASRCDHLLQSRAGVLAGRRGGDVNDMVREMQMPATISVSFQGTVREFRTQLPGDVDSARSWRF